MTCPFCAPLLDEQEIKLENELCLFLQRPLPVLNGSGLIIPKAHRRTFFELTAAEWAATYELLQTVKAQLDQTLQPDGYNVGWNCEQVGGQEVFHAHLHVIPRFVDEPLAGKGIRYWLKQADNRRPAR
ncbi:MAG: HIT family protein [Caldilineaceae bacterium]